MSYIYFGRSVQIVSFFIGQRCTVRQGDTKWKKISRSIDIIQLWHWVKGENMKKFDFPRFPMVFTFSIGLDLKEQQQQQKSGPWASVKSFFHCGPPSDRKIENFCTTWRSRPLGHGSARAIKFFHVQAFDRINFHKLYQNWVVWRLRQERPY